MRHKTQTKVENLKQVFKAMETITTATREPQKLRFMIGKKLFSFSVETVGKEYIISSVINYSSEIENYILDSMVVEKVTDKFIFMYSYSMLDTRIDEKIALSAIEVIK